MRTRNFHYVVWHEDDIKKLFVFTECPLVEKFAYVKHQGNSDNNPHYHFYFVIRGSDEFPSKLNGVNDNYCVGCNVSENDILNYFLRLLDGSGIYKRTFRTNIDGYKKYNGA